MFTVRRCLAFALLALAACGGGGGTKSETTDLCANVACAALDACHAAGTCDPGSGRCSNPPRPAGTPCDDGNGCTLADTCQAGVCVGGIARACPAGPCTAAGTCDAATGRCVNPPKPDATPCDDGSLCTTGDACQGGVCVGTSALVCTAPDACHAPGSCDPSTGTCSAPVDREGASCALSGAVGVCRAGACAAAEGFEGTYNVHSLSAGAWSGWGEGTATVDRDGEVREYFEDFSDGTLGTTSPFPRVLVDAAGHLTLPFYGSYWGTLSTSGAEGLSTYQDLDGSAVLVVHQRQTVSLSTSDLAGKWNVHALAVGLAYDEAVWYRGVATIDASGAVTQALVDRYGGAGSDAFGTRVEPSGAVQRVYPFLTAGRGSGTLSPGGQLLAGVWTPLAGGSALEVAVRAGAAPRLADLAGDWSFHVLSASDLLTARTGAGHGALAVDAAGALAIVYQSWTAPGLAVPDGTLQVDASGAVLHSAIASLVGHLSADGELLVATFSWDLGGDALLVAQRRRVPPVRPVLEHAATVTATLDETGGTIRAVASDGTTYRLDLPAGALAAGAPVDVSVTPIASLPGLPVNGAFLGAAQFSPDGLQLLQPATLSIGRSGGSPPAEVIGFTYSGLGLDRVSFLPAGDPGAIVLDLTHFSGAGAAAGSAAGQADSDQAFADQLRVLYQVQGADATAAFEQVFDAWLGAIIAGVSGSASLEQLMNQLAPRLDRWGAFRQLLELGTGSVCVDRPGRAGDLKAVLGAKVPAFITDVETACKAEHSPCARLDDLSKLEKWNAMILSWGDAEGCLGLSQTPVCGACGPSGDSTPAQATIHCAPPPTGACGPIAIVRKQTRDLYPSILDVCGRDAGASDANPGGAFPEWRSLQPEVANVGAVGTVTGVDLGVAPIELRVRGMPCIPPAVTKVRVVPNTRYLVTVTRMTITNSGIDCGVVTDKPGAYVINLLVDAEGRVTVTSFTALIREETKGTNNRMSGSRATFQTSAFNFYLPVYGDSPNWLIQRAWHLQGGADGMVGYYDWSWTGTFSGGHFTGCSGQNLVRLDPVAP